MITNRSGAHFPEKHQGFARKPRQALGIYAIEINMKFL
jgi:hypothetical protein